MEIKDLIAWLEEDDAKSREIRAERLRYLLDIIPIPPEGISFLGGEQSEICFDEVRRCYLDGSYMAVVLLSLAYVERTLAAELYARGWSTASTAPLNVLLERAYEEGVLSKSDWQICRRLAELRNSHAHFQGFGNPKEKQPMMDRMVQENATATEILAKDAKFAVALMAKIVRRQFGFRVGLGTD